jgi:hypothetical protein
MPAGPAAFTLFKKIMSKPLRSLLPALLVLLFSYAAVSKLLTFALFQRQLLNQPIPPQLARPLAWLLPLTELLTAGLLLFRPTRLAGLWAAFGLMALFSGYIALVLSGFWDRVPCSCGGILSHLSWQAHFWFNLCFLGIALTALLCHDPDGEHPRAF